MRNKIEPITICIKVKTNQRHNRYISASKEKMIISLKASPEGEKANHALIQLLSKTFRISSKDISIVLGKHQPTKLVSIMGVTYQDFEEIVSSLL